MMMANYSISSKNVVVMIRNIVVITLKYHSVYSVVVIMSLTMFFKKKYYDCGRMILQLW